MEQAEKSRRGKRDRISSLPDCLIHLIMSFLTAQEVVRTCVLSKRWKNLWTTSPFLDFDWCKFECDQDDGDSFDRELEDRNFQRNKLQKFRNFVSITLLLREATDMHKFRLSCYRMPHDGRDNSKFVKSWILYALKRNLQVLTVNFRTKVAIDFSTQEVSLPLGVFSCASLVDLSLHFYISVDDIKVINLPRLRRLSFKGINLSQDFVDNIFYGCPMLEYLHLGAYAAEFCTINSQSLKYLEVDCWCSYRETEKPMELINTPNLLSFSSSICLNLIGSKFLLKMPMLTYASICLSRCHSDCSFKGKSNIISCLSNVQNLKLSGRWIKDILEIELSKCREFSNVKDLAVNDLCLSCHFNLLACFLNLCPNLEMLSLHYRGCFCEEEVQRNQESLKIAPFKGEQLETVDVIFSRNDKSFPRVMTYLQDITEKTRAQIKMTSLYNWLSEDKAADCLNDQFTEESD